MGIRLLETCLIPGNERITWQAAWDKCHNQGARLLELPDSAYNDAYLNLKSTFKFNEPTDDRWLALVRDTADEPPKRTWKHGNESVNVGWAPKVNTHCTFPCYGYVTLVKKTYLRWSEGSASSVGWYFCQIALAVGEMLL